MRNRVTAALSVVVAVVMTWAMYNTALSGICFLRDGKVVCEPENWVYGFTFWAGFMAQFALMFAGARLVAVAGIFGPVAVGTTLAGTLGADRGGTGEHVAIGLTFFAAMLAPVVLFLVLATRTRNRSRDLVLRGAEAVGTVVSVEDTGGTVNNNPRLRMRFRIEPLDGVTLPFEVEKTAVVPRIEIPRRGDRYPVWYDPADPTRWAFATGTPAEGADPKAVRLWELAKRGTGTPLPPPARTDSDVVAELSRLNDQRMRGEIDTGEFAWRTADLLAGAP